MKAVVLVGGEGTRLRPLTDTMPKPLVPLVDRPILDHVLDHLARHGVREVVLSSSYLEEKFRDFLGRRREPRITWITEAEPLGTGGAIVHALGALDTDEPFLALNGDILTDLDLTALVARHRERERRSRRSRCTTSRTRDRSVWSPTDPDGRVLEFREKPAEPIPGDVNAGTYVLEPAALEGWTAGANVSIEREIFPRLIADGRPLCGFATDAYWIDLGTPEQYLRASFDLLDGVVAGADGYEAPYLPGSGVDAAAVVGRHVVAGPAVSVSAGAAVDESVLLDGAVVEGSAVVRRSIVGPNARVRAHARVTDSVLGQDARVEAGAVVHGARVSAGERIPGS